MINKTCINDALKSSWFRLSEHEASINNYREDSIDEVITKIISPIRKELQTISLTTFPERKKCNLHIKKYQKELFNVRSLDYTELANRALGIRGIVGETGAESIDLRAKKAEWRCCLNIMERLGSRLGNILSDHPELGEVFTVIKPEPESSIYPLVIRLLKAINRQMEKGSSSSS